MDHWFSTWLFLTVHNKVGGEELLSGLPRSSFLIAKNIDVKTLLHVEKKVKKLLRVLCSHRRYFPFDNNDFSSTTESICCWLLESDLFSHSFPFLVTSLTKRSEA